jgi:hypothetical protein
MSYSETARPDCDGVVPGLAYTVPACAKPAVKKPGGSDEALPEPQAV